VNELLENDTALVVCSELLEPMVFKLVTMGPRPATGVATVTHCGRLPPRLRFYKSQSRSCFKPLGLYVSSLSAVFVFVTLVFADMAWYRQRPAMIPPSRLPGGGGAGGLARGDSPL
jgi:hypothetical protein